MFLNGFVDPGIQPIPVLIAVTLTALLGVNEDAMLLRVLIDSFLVEIDCALEVTRLILVLEKLNTELSREFCFDFFCHHRSRPKVASATTKLNCCIMIC